MSSRYHVHIMLSLAMALGVFVVRPAPAAERGDIVVGADVGALAETRRGDTNTGVALGLRAGIMVSERLALLVDNLVGIPGADYGDNGFTALHTVALRYSTSPRTWVGAGWGRARHFDCSGCFLVTGQGGFAAAGREVWRKGSIAGGITARAALAKLGSHVERAATLSLGLSWH